MQAAISNVAVAFALAGGTVIFMVVVVVFFFAFVFGYYTRKGSAISQRPYRRPDAPPESPSELAHDTTQDVRNWQRGTHTQHREHRPKDSSQPPDPVANALADWRRGSRTTRVLDPPVGPADHVRGSDHAPSVAVYLDVSSEPCRSTYQLLARFADVREIRLAVRQLPLADVHPLSLPAANALEAAANQGQFFELLDRLSGAWVGTEAELLDLASQYVADPERLRQDVQAERCQASVIEQIRQAKASGAHTVPAIYINGTPYDGPIWRDELDRTLRRLGEPE
jgi:Thioredoxin